MDAERVLERIRSDRALAVLRGIGLGDGLLELAETLVAAGVVLLEVTLDSPDALTSIAKLRSELDGRATVGAGTVRDEREAVAAIDAGAAFLVAPGLDLASVAAARSRGVAMLPGVLTPTEVQRARQAGCTTVKLFPAGSFGPGYLKALSGPFSDVGFVPTGGIGPDEVAPFLEAGAVAVGFGSSLTRDLPDLSAVARSAAEHRRAVDDAPRPAR